MISFREFLLEARTQSHIDDWKKYLDTTFVELTDGKFKIKVGDKEGAVEFDKDNLKTALNNVMTASTVKSAMGYAGARIPVGNFWNALEAEQKKETEQKNVKKPVTDAVRSHLVAQSNNTKLGQSTHAPRTDLDKWKSDNGITKQDEEYYEDHYFSGKKENVHGGNNRPYYTKRVIDIKNMLRGQMKENGLQSDDSIEDMEQALVANGIEINTYKNAGRELEKDIAKTLDQTLDPDKNKGNIKISDDTLKDEKFISALEDSGLQPSDKLLNAEQANNNDESDIVVSWNGKGQKSKDRRFFIEAKLDYDSAPVSHFRISIKDNKIQVLDKGRVTSSASKANKQEELDQFISDLEGQEKVSKILLVSDEFKNFTEAYSKAIDSLLNSNCQKRLGLKLDKNEISKEQFKKLSNGCDAYIQLYKTQYQKLLEELVSMKETDSDEKNSIIETFRKYFPDVKQTDDDGLVEDPTISNFIESLDPEKRDQAFNIILKIRTIHNKFAIIIKSTGRNIDSLKDNDKALFMLWAFILKSKSQKTKHRLLNGFDLNRDDNSRRILSFESKDREYTKIIGDLISKYYGGMKDVAYI